MATKKAVAAKQAKYGEKMIEVKVRFWTDSIAPNKGEIVPRHAHTSGVVRMEKNAAHGIVPNDPVPFNSLLDLTSVIEEVLLAHEVTLHASSRMKRYMQVDG